MVATVRYDKDTFVRATLGSMLAWSLFGCACPGAAERYYAQAVVLERSRPSVAPPALSEEARERASPFGSAVLDKRTLVQAVLERNPGIESARQGWRAALARYRQVTALDDPMLSYSLAPLTIRSGDVSFGQVIQLSQRFPFPGKLALLGDAALFEAEAQQWDYHAARLRLALLAATLFDDYYTVHRALEINDQHIALLKDFKRSAEAQYAVGKASPQDPLQAEVELIHLEHDKLVLVTQREIVAAQMNGLLHRRPDLPLPPAPASLPDPPGVPGTIADLQQEALRRRPEQFKSRAQVAGRESARLLARRMYYPDFSIMASYNSLWAEVPRQFLIGLSLNLPIQLGRRSGAVEEAEARLLRAQSEVSRTTDDVLLQVDQAYRRALLAHHVVLLYQDRLLPAARDQVAAARSGFATGRNSFVALIDAERNLRTVELRFQMTLADLDRRQAELDQARGQVPGLTPEGGVR